MDCEDGENDPVAQLFQQFVHAGTCKSILSTFQQLCDRVGLKHVDHRHFYRRLRSRITSWQAQALWAKLDKRASHKEYRKGEACANTRVLIVGGGPCGLRTAIEVALLGGKAVLLEKRDRFTRNNVLHLWPFLITDLKNLGAKKFFGKFCAGAIDHISIRQLQCILLKVALIVGVEVHVNVGFEGLIYPTCASTGWKCKVDPKDHPVSEYEFDVLVGADGKRNTLEGFKRKEFRGKLAIAITANFINSNTQAEARVEEISGVAFIFNQKFFKDLNAQTGIDLENIVYYKDETHYFVMTAKKNSLLEKGVLKADYADAVSLLHPQNINQENLLSYAREAADFSTNHELPRLDYAVNHYGQADIAMFDFTSIFAAENASRVVERQGHKLLLTLVGDSLLEPFWPIGSGCARGFLGGFDAAWMIKNWASGKMTTLEVIAQRESIYQLLSQSTPESLNKNFNQYTLDPHTRYCNHKAKHLRPEQVRHLYDSGEITYKDEIVEIPAKRAKSDYVDTYSLLRWCQQVLNTGKFHTIHIKDLTTSWKSGLALCALIHSFKPELIDYSSLNEADVKKNNQLAFDIAEREFGITPVMTGEDMESCDKPDKLTMVSYLSHFHEMFRKHRTASLENRNNNNEETLKRKSPSHRMSLLQKLKTRASLSKLRKSKKDKEEEEKDQSHQHHQNNHHEHKHHHHHLHTHSRDIYSLEEKKSTDMNGDVHLTKFSKLPMEEIANKLTVNNKAEEVKVKDVQSGNIKVSAMAEILVSKFKTNCEQPPQQPVRRMKGQPTLLAAQPASEFCFFCKKRVYIMERMSAEGVFFHRHCLKCDYCGVGLRLNNYSVDRTSYGDAIRFFCGQHARAESRVKQRRKRSFNGDDDVFKENIPSKPEDEWSPPTKVSTPSRSPKKGSIAPLSPILNVPDDNLSASLKTPERIEFENTLEGAEESEEEQTEHNLRASMSSDAILMDEEEDTDSDLESDEDEFQEAVDLFNEGRLEESICLAKESLRRSQENLLDDMNRYGDEMANGEDGSDTEVEDSEYESDEDTEMEEETTEPTSSKTEPVSAPSSSLGVSQSVHTPTSPGGVSHARANFFSSPAEPVRLDPWKMFGMDKKEDKTETVTGETNDVEETIESDNEATEGTDNQVADQVLDNDREKEGGATDEEAEDTFATAEYQLDSDDDDNLDQTAVNRAMEELLADMDKRSSVRSSISSINDGFKASGEDEDEDDVFLDNKYGPVSKKKSSSSRLGSGEYSRKKVSSRARSGSDYLSDKQSSRSKSGSDYGDSDKVKSKLRSRSSSEFEADTGKLLRSVQQVSDNTTSGSGETTLQVLDSVNRVDDQPSDQEIERCVQNIDDRFVTRTRGHPYKKKVKSRSSKLRSRNSGSSDSSFTISTPSQSSVTSSTSSLSGGEWGSNKRLVSNDTEESEDEKPDEDMLREYRLTLSHALGEDSDELSPCEQENTPREDGDLDTTLNAEVVDQSNVQSPDYHSLNSSVYETPNASMTENPPKDYRKVESMEVDPVIKDSSVKSVENSKQRRVSDTEYKMCRPARQDSLESPVSVPHSSGSEFKMCRPVRQDSVEKSDSSQKSDSSEKNSVPNSRRDSSSSASGGGPRSNWRPLPPLPKESAASPQFSKHAKHGTGRKLPEIGNLKSKNPPGQFQSQFMKKIVGSPSNSKEFDKNSDEGEDLVSQKKESVSEVKENVAVVPTQVRALPPRPQPVSKQSEIPQNLPTKTKVAVDYSKLSFHSDSSSGKEEKGVGKGKKVIPVDSSLKNAKTRISSMEDNIDDIPFADDSEDDVMKDKYFTPATSVKTSPKISRDRLGVRDIRKRILPTPPKPENQPVVLSPEHIRDIRKAEMEKAREKARERARLKSDEELGLQNMDYTPSGAPVGKKVQRQSSQDNSENIVRQLSQENSVESVPSRTSSQSNTPSVSDILSDSDDMRTYKKKIQPPSEILTPQLPSYESTPKSLKEKKKKKKSKDKIDEGNSSVNSDQCDEVKKEKKKRSLLAAILGKSSTSTPDKHKGVKERDRSSSTDTLDEKPSKKNKKTPKSVKYEKKKDKKRKTKSVGTMETELSENMRDLKIGSMFTGGSLKRPGRAVRTIAPTASGDELTESDDDLSLSPMTTSTDTLSRRTKSEHTSMSEEQLNAKIAKKIQHAARKQQKQQEQKRLRQAQEIQRKLEEVDVKQRELEERGIIVEKALRKEGPEAERPEPELMQDWFNLVHEKNSLVRYESELMVSARELELEDRQGRLQSRLRESMGIEAFLLDPGDDVFGDPEIFPVAIAHWKKRLRNPDFVKSPEQKERERRIYAELIEVVEERDKLVAMVEEERLREQEEDRDLEAVMQAKGFASPMAQSRIGQLRASREVKAS